ncbi:MAG: DUF1801 domain-containing protein [Chryseolinea sp.]
MLKPASDFRSYTRAFPPDVKERLDQMRDAILSVVPNVEESIRYGMPAFKVGKEHVYIAGYKNHIGMYPMSRKTELEKTLAHYRVPKAKDSIHFKHSEELPLDVIKSIVQFKLARQQD